MPQGDICTHLVQGSSLHQLERGGIYTAAVKAHVLVQLLLFPSIYLTQEREESLLQLPAALLSCVPKLVPSSC